MFSFDSLVDFGSKALSNEIHQSGCRKRPVSSGITQGAGFALYYRFHRWNRGRQVHIKFGSLRLLTKYRIVGFDDLGNTDNFTTAHLEYRLIETGLDLETIVSNDQQE